MIDANSIGCEEVLAYSNLIGHYSSSVWARFIGQVLTSAGKYLVTPFITLYLYEKLHMGILFSMGISSIPSLAGVFGNVVAGYLADRYGRKKLMVVSLFGQGICVGAYAFSSTALLFIMIAIFEGVFSSIFSPSANAHIADTISEDQRVRVFSLLNLGTNIGGSLGPVIAVLSFRSHASLMFILSSIFFIGTAVILGTVLTEVKRNRPLKETGNEYGQLEKVGLMMLFYTYLPVIWISFLSLPICMLYSLVKTGLPIHLSHHFSNYAVVYSTMLTFNGITVIALQMFITHFTRNRGLFTLLVVSMGSFALVCFGYAWAPSLAILLIAEFIFTIGEMIGFPQLQKYISQIAPADKRGRYFSIYALRWNLAGFIGPFAGAWVLGKYGGDALFVGMGILVLLFGIVLVASIAVLNKRLLNDRTTQ